MNVTLTGKKKNSLYTENRVLTLKVLDLPTEEVREVPRTYSKEIILVFFGVLFFVFILYKIISYVAIDLEFKPLRKK